MWSVAFALTEENILRSEDAPPGRKTSAGGSSGSTVISSSLDETESSFVNLECIRKRIMFSDNIPLVTVNTDATVYFSGVANIPVVPLANPGCLSDSAIFITSVMKSTDTTVVDSKVIQITTAVLVPCPMSGSPTSEPTMAPLSTLAVVEVQMYTSIQIPETASKRMSRLFSRTPQVEKYVKALEEELRAPYVMLAAREFIEVASKVEATAIEVSETTFSFMDDALKQVWDSAL
ncbi:hypothetical protein V6N13_108604 [Hibiscus sabdariffa]